MAQVSEIYVKLGLDAKKFDQGLSNAKKKLALFAAEITATVYLIDRFVERSTNAATRITNMANASGIAATKLRQMGIAAAMGNAGIKAEEASKQIAEFGKNLYSLSRWGEGNAEGFNKLQTLGRGVAFYGRETADIISEISEKIRGLDDQTATNVLAAFGLSPEMLPFMRDFNGLMAQAGAEFGRTADQISDLEKADRTIAHFKLELADFADRINIMIAPAIERLGKAIHDFNPDNGSLQALSVVLKSIATSLTLISAGGNSIMDAASIAASSASGSSESANVNAEIRAKNKSMWAETWASLRGMWSASPASSPLKAGTNNWGNLRGVDGQFRSFATPQEGMNAMVADLRAKISGASPAMRNAYGAGYVPSLENILKVYAPAGDNNNPAAYAKYVSGQTGINASRPLTEADLAPVIRAMAQMEGNRNITLNTTNNVHGDNAKMTAELIASEMERNIKYALTDQNNGAR